MFAANGCKAVIFPSHAVAALLLLVATIGSVRAGEETSGPAKAESVKALSLSQRIDQQLQSTLPLPVAPTESEGTLLRRLSLDLRGVVPTREELDEYVAEDSADRWSNWVDRFLQDPLSDEHLVTFLDRTLMLRRGHSHVDRSAWISYLREHVAVGTPLDALSQELLYSPWWNRDHRAAQRFYLDRSGDPHLTTRDLARVFLGRDLQCAQCHDHPLIDDYRQVDYHGLLAFVSASSLAEVTYKDAEGKDQKVQLHVEQAAGDAPFESVFERGTMLRSGPRLVGQPEHFDSYALPDQRYLDQPPEGALQGAATPPKVSRREQLARRLADRSNPDFVSNWANRLWALVYGRGLVHPVDMIEPSNPPSHPELYSLISEGLLQSDMRIKPFLRQLVMAQAYRRTGASEWLRIAKSSSEVQVPEARQRLVQGLAKKIPEIEARIESLNLAEDTKLAAYESAREAWLKIQAERTLVRAELDSADASMVDAKKKRDEANAAAVAAQKALHDNNTRINLLDGSSTNLEQALALAGGEDAELSQAIAVSKQRAETARATTPMLEKGVADTQATLMVANSALEQATARINEVVGKLEPIRASLQVADKVTIAARADWFTARSATAVARREQLQTKRMADWLVAIDQFDQLNQSLQSTDEQIVAANKQTESLRVAVEAKKKELSVAEQAMQSAVEAVRLAKETSDQNRLVVVKLEQAFSSLGEASKLVGQVESLVAAQATLRTEIGVKQKQFEDLRVHAGEANVRVNNAKTTLESKQAELESQMTASQQHMRQVVGLETRRAELQTEFDTTRTEAESIAVSVAEDRSRQLDSTGLYPLTPEQMCWSTLRVTGVFDAYVRTEIAELEKQSPLPKDAGDVVKAERQRQAVRQAIEKLRGIADHYVSLYASGPDKTQDDYFASADQALYVSNGGSVFSWAGPGNQNPTQIATTLDDPAEVARVLYWSYLCRQPTTEETATVTEQLSSAGDQRNAIIHEMAWSLLASAEFRFVR